MSIFEYDEEKHLKSERKEWHEKGIDNLARLLKSLMDAGKPEEVERILNDSEYRMKLVNEYFREENSPL